jgi:Protein of unknown function (DUF4058)
MPCPFPGMDPFIERPDIWADFHDAMITAIRGQLQPKLRPRYVAVMQSRLYIIDDDQVRKPDVTIVHSPDRPARSGAAAVLDVDTPAVFEVYREEVREPFVEIIEPHAGERVVTAIEVLSPFNKRPGAGRAAYLAKRQQYEVTGVNVVEVDLLRAGQTTVSLGKKELDSLQPWRYLAAVSRWPSIHEIYAFPLERRLPKIAVPLLRDDDDVPLDLQSAFARAWEEGPYPELLRYHDLPPGELTELEQRWCREQLTKAGFGTAA